MKRSPAYMSKDAREIVDRFGIGPMLYVIVDDVILRHPKALLNGCDKHSVRWILDTIPTKPTTLPDAPSASLTQYVDAYLWVCEEYVTHDFSRIDLLKLANILSQYPLEVIERVGKKCKALGHFTIPYLAAVLESEGAGAIEELRREQRLNELVSQSKPVELPAQRFPGQLRARLHENVINEEIEKQHDDIRRG